MAKDLFKGRLTEELLIKRLDGSLPGNIKVLDLSDCNLKLTFYLGILITYLAMFTFLACRVWISKKTDFRLLLFLENVRN